MATSIRSDSKDSAHHHRRSERDERTRGSKGSHKGDRKERKRRRERDDRKKKRKKARKRRDASSESSSSSDSDAATVDLERAAEVVRMLLLEFPSIAVDLLSMLQLMDGGEAAVINGIANARVKALLKALFVSLGLRKLRTPDDAYVVPTASKGLYLLETVASLLGTSAEEGSTKQVKGDKVHGSRKRDVPIGPALPPTSFTSNTTRMDEGEAGDEGEEDDFVGPALQGTRGFRLADERVELEMARQAKLIEEDEWRRARGEAPLSASPVSSGGREAWMTEIPENNKILEEAMGGAMAPRTGKPAAFRSREPAKIDSTWFDAPAERERSKRARLDMELLGYVRPENAPTPVNAADGRVVATGASTNPSIVPVANPEADQEMRRQMNALKQKRGPSLLEQHQERIANDKKANKAGGGGADKSTWNRERDLTARRALSREDADRIVSASKDISSKFTAPTVTRQFL